jgi:hypothetical protein
VVAAHRHYRSYQQQDPAEEVIGDLEAFRSLVGVSSTVPPLRIRMSGST